MTVCTYAIDAQDRIASVGDSWLDFARENDAPGLSDDDVVGRSIFEFIAGQETQHLYVEIFSRVRRTGTSVTLPFRCDAPDRRRFMRITLSSTDGEHIAFVSEIVREETRPPVPGVGATMADEPGARVLTMCSWCKRLRVDDVEWLEIEDAVTALDLFRESALPPITHGLCGGCLDDVRSGLPS